MGTTSITRVVDGDGNVLVTMLKSFDGYPQVYGFNLAKFLTPKSIIRSSLIGRSDNHAVGIECLAAQIVTHFKGNNLGVVYLTNNNNTGDHIYTVYLRGDTICIRYRDQSYRVVFEGTAKAFRDYIKSCSKERDLNEYSIRKEET